MRVHTERRGPLAIVRPVGRLAGPDLTLRSSVSSAANDGSRHLILDLVDVSQIDSSGVSELVATYTAARRCGASLDLARMSPRVAEVVLASQLRTIFGIYATVEDAVAAQASIDDAEGG